MKSTQIVTRRPRSLIKQLAFSFCILALFCANIKGDEDIYHSDFGASKDGWIGRAGVSGSALTVVFDREKHGDSLACSVETDGTLGSGITFSPSIKVQKGTSYLLSFWIKSPDSKAPDSNTITYRITDSSGLDYGSTDAQWSAVPDQHSDWVKVERPFTATSSAIGFEFARNSAHDPSLLLSISDVKVVKASK